MKQPLAATIVVSLLFPAAAAAQLPLATCTQIDGASFSGPPNHRTLRADCRTSETIVVPDGTTLDGNFRTIVAFDPDANGFKGGVIANATPGSEHVTVKNLIVDTESLANVCDDGATRLRGILFDGASGTIRDNTVLHINQGASGCQEGNAIEVRNLDSPGITTVSVTGNQVYDYQKTGILINGSVTAEVSHNIVGQSATQDDLAANAIQIGFGAVADVVGNQIEGKSGDRRLRGHRGAAVRSGHGHARDRRADQSRQWKR
jgi:hypothetical protein